MKPIITALGICAVLLAGGSASGAALLTAFTWDGSSSSAWNVDNNWTANSSYPDKNDDGNDSATISDTTNNPVTLPAFDICLTTFTMSGATSFDAKGETLTAKTSATFDSTNSSTAIVLDNTSTTNGDDGFINASQIVINGGASGTLVSVTATGGEAMTLQTGAYSSCP